jgi:glycosyltransferase involved in cell wall biosynthesis
MVGDGAPRAGNLRVQFIAKPARSMSGIERYTRDLSRGLAAAGVDVQVTHPEPVMAAGPVSRMVRRLGLDAGAFFANYPLHVRPLKADVYHLTTQTLATLLCFQRLPGPVVVTVHDIIPYLVRKDAELNTLRSPADRLFYRLALTGLRRADALIADSKYTRQTLIDALGYPPDRIHVVYLSVDREVFRPRPVPKWFRQRYGIHEGVQHILYVGSEDPRKNLATLVRAFAIVRGQMPDVRLIKAGAGHFPEQRFRLARLAADLNLDGQVLFLDYIPEEDLPLLYNVADVFVLPSLYEGFGLPALEAMSCGLPVVAARASSLPEIVGEAGMQVAPLDEREMAGKIIEALGQESGQGSRSDNCLLRAACFSPENQVANTAPVYRGML